MESITTYNRHHAGWPPDNQGDDCNIDLLAESAGPFSTEIAHILGSLEFNWENTGGASSDASYQGSADPHFIFDLCFPVLKASPADQIGQKEHLREAEEVSWPGEWLSPQSQLLSPPNLMDNQDLSTAFLTCSPNVQDSSLKAQRPTVRRRRRRQNHACDPCRSSKKACDLPRGVCTSDDRATKPCSGCKMRGIDCTVSWLASRQLVRQTDRDCGKPNSVMENDAGDREGTDAAEIGHDALASLSTLETDLSRSAMAGSICSQYFNLFIDISDSFLSQCLVQGSMPPPYKFGVAAYDTLSASAQLSACIERAERWVSTCWHGSLSRAALTASPSPCIFRAVSVLDALLSPTPGASRDASITEAYKWVAIATAAQLAIHKEGEAGNVDGVGAQSQLRGVALVSWQKAKELVFRNIAATGSFRLALSLVFFGDIIPPNSSTIEEDKEDRAFAFCEGIKRLRALCLQTRSDIEAQKEMGSTPRSTSFNTTSGGKRYHIPNLPPEANQLILELVGALEWLVSLYNTIAIGTSYGKICPFPLEAEDDEPTISSGMESPASSHIIDDDTLSPLLAWRCPQEIENSIVARVQQGGSSFIEFWKNNVHESEAVLYAGRLFVSLSILLWRSLARFTIGAAAVDTGNAKYSDIDRDYTAMIDLIELWRTHFGKVDLHTKLCLQQSDREVWRMSAFCSVDTDFAILLFYNVAQRLEKRLVQLPSIPAKERLSSSIRSTRARRSTQRLVSAIQIATISSTCQGSAPAPLCQPIPTYGRYMCAHPSPWAVIQLHTLAAQAFSDEINNPSTPPDAKHASEMTLGLNTCLRGLLGLRDNLFMAPGPAQVNN
ncbi:Zn(II)2Cys6 transcription factor domain-containing protein [Aspergillus alliaceus]|uniref:Zn(II)2Cys6 transcription factor domain-containing protein n=1 Tax=Petromyces alliaceus TaxID=209559 RepID=UPI0012A6BCC5|nr:uncharacterized protein BDW43DRAFT_199636 [Aspergillus alliaceus]KAB8228961.1 hypothetical protein BDW43DRAFT_199636 [Aspergillus alliaceus]